MSWKEERMLAWMRAEALKRQPTAHIDGNGSTTSDRDTIRDAMWPGVGERGRRMPSEERARELIADWQQGR